MMASKSRFSLSADPDWSGGGFGKYKGLPLKEIEARFEQCVADPSMRSVSAVLRIAREQIEARGDLGKQPYYAAFFAAVALALLGVSFFFPEDLRKKAWMMSGGMFLAFFAFLAGAVSTRKARGMNLRQERAIREKAGWALEELLKHDFQLKPLLREQQETLSEIQKQTGPRDAYRRLQSS
ncbi:MAG: hypothetical protein ACAH95_17865 [Fimbriimonas sp.]